MTHKQTLQKIIAARAGRVQIAPHHHFTRQKAEDMGYTMHRLGDQTIMVGPSGREQPYRSEREALDALEMALEMSVEVL